MTIRKRITAISNSDDDDEFRKFQSIIEEIFRSFKSNPFLRIIRTSLVMGRFSNLLILLLNGVFEKLSLEIEGQGADMREDKRIVELGVGIESLKSQTGEHVFKGSIIEVLNDVFDAIRSDDGPFEIAFENSYVHGRHYLQFYRLIVETMAEQYYSIPKLFFAYAKNRKYPEIDAILIIVLPVVMPELRRKGKLQAKMEEIVQIISSISEIAQTEAGPKWLIPNSKNSARLHH